MNAPRSITDQSGTGTPAEPGRRPPLEDLVEDAIDATVRTGQPAAGRDLVAKLAHRGAEALWEGALLFLGLLASRPVYGLPEHGGRRPPAPGRPLHRRPPVRAGFAERWTPPG
ncbi:hypothetical protein [Streptomyces sp. NPDC057579]|uniref:hypothetical protein n=1 Tax=Streptomyces sp. NPDC057579 TaxID=3346172 RepID=UPI0036AFC2B1